MRNTVEMAEGWHLYIGWITHNDTHECNNFGCLVRTHDAHIETDVGVVCVWTVSVYTRSLALYNNLRNGSNTTMADNHEHIQLSALKKTFVIFISKIGILIAKQWGSKHKK